MFGIEIIFDGVTVFIDLDVLDNQRFYLTPITAVSPYYFTYPGMPPFDSNGSNDSHTDSFLRITAALRRTRSVE